MDTQTIEILGRNRLIDELLMAGLEVAMPIRDRGIDLITYVDLVAATSKFAAIPIQMKAASTRAFSIDAKYEKISNLVVVYVWGLRSPEHAQIFALTYAEVLEIASIMKWTSTLSWKKGSYSTSAPSKKLCELLEPHRMTSDTWRKKLSKVSEIAL
jgi:ribosomal protein L11